MSNLANLITQIPPEKITYPSFSREDIVNIYNKNRWRQSWYQTIILFFTKLYPNMFMLSTVFNTYSPQQQTCTITEGQMSLPVFSHCNGLSCDVDFTNDLCPYLDTCKAVKQVDNVIQNNNLHCDDQQHFISSMYGFLQISSFMIGAFISTRQFQKHFGPYQMVKYAGPFIILTTILLTIFRNDYRLQLVMQVFLGCIGGIYQFNSLFLLNELNGFNSMPFTTALLSMDPLITFCMAVFMQQTDSILYWYGLIMSLGIPAFILFVVVIPESPYYYFQKNDKDKTESIVNDFCKLNDLPEITIKSIHIENNYDNITQSKHQQWDKGVVFNTILTVILYQIVFLACFFMYFYSKQIKLEIHYVLALNGIAGTIANLTNVQSIRLIGIKNNIFLLFTLFIISISLFQTSLVDTLKYIQVALMIGLSSALINSVFIMVNTQFDEFAIPKVFGLCNSLGRLGQLASPILGEYVDEPMYFLIAIGALGILINFFTVNTRSIKKHSELN